MSYAPLSDSPTHPRGDPSVGREEVRRKWSKGSRVPSSQRPSLPHAHTVLSFFFLLSFFFFLGSGLGVLCMEEIIFA